jgi:formylmethanofuran dehydrogenase subunit E
LTVACAAAPLPEPITTERPPPGERQTDHPTLEKHPQRASSDEPATTQRKLDEVAHVHGGAGPWAVAGYRMGEHALRALAVERGSFDLEIVHHTPPEVQYACVADGAAAATGASLGKLNLTLADAPAADTHTVYRKKSTGQSVTLRVTRAFAARFNDVLRERLPDAGREAMQLPDHEIFEADREGPEGRE